MRIGILGGGQLGFMTILRGTYMGFEFNVLDKTFDIPSRRTPAKLFTFENYFEFYNESDIITFEFEHIPIDIVKHMKEKLKPSYEILLLKQSRFNEKKILLDNKFPVPKFFRAENGKLACEIIKKNNFIPCVVKTTKLGYDGKGQFYIKNDENLREIFNLNEELIIEEYIDFEMEVSTIVARNELDIKIYPISQNFHKDGILIYNITPARIPKKLENKIYEIAIELSKTLNLIGIMAIEFFVKDDDVLINEIAPRPHNSGHWTLDGSITSQFEQFLRAILNLPLGETSLIKPTLMINLLGVDKPNLNEIFKIKNSYFYWYFKEKRIRRKMGHINILLDEYDNFKDIVKSILHQNKINI